MTVFWGFLTLHAPWQVYYISSCCVVSLTFGKPPSPNFSQRSLWMSLIEIWYLLDIRKWNSYIFSPLQEQVPLSHHRHELYANNRGINSPSPILPLPPAKGNIQKWRHAKKRPLEVIHKSYGPFFFWNFLYPHNPFVDHFTK